MAVSALATLAFWARPRSDMIDRASEIEARHPEDKPAATSSIAMSNGPPAQTPSARVMSVVSCVTDPIQGQGLHSPTRWTFARRAGDSDVMLCEPETMITTPTSARVARRLVTTVQRVAYADEADGQLARFVVVIGWNPPRDDESRLRLRRVIARCESSSGSWKRANLALNQA
jgi:hypothetical protein